MRRHIAVPCAVVLALSAAGLTAQQVTFRSRTDLVIVDAVVVDTDGHTVRGLKASDFVVTDRRRPLEIATFEEVSHARPAPTADAVAATLPPTLKLDVASNMTVQADRLVVIVIDDLHIWRGRTEKAKALARDIVTKLGTQASMAVIFSSRDGSTEITQDRSVLLAAIDGMKARQTFRRPHQAFLPQKARYVDPSAPIEFKLAAIQEAQRVSLSDMYDNVQYFGTLTGAAKMLLQEDRRRKAFVVLSEGLDADLSRLNDGGQSTLLIETAPPPEGAGGTPAFRADQDALENAMDALRRSNVALYAIDPRGKVRSEDMMRESWPPPDCEVCNSPPALPEPAERFKPREGSQFAWENPVRRAQDGLGFMAGAAGGFAVTNTDDLTGGLSRILADLDHYYLLGFYPPSSGGSATRPVDVKVPGHPEYTIRFRRGYMSDAPTAPLKSKDPLAELAGGVMPKGDLPLRLTAMALPGTGNDAHVAIALEVTAPVGQMKEADNKLRDDVSYAVMVLDGNRSKVTQRTGRSATFTLLAQDPDRALPASVTYQIPLAIDLAPGRYQLRAAALSKKLGTGGSVYLDITVPDFSTTPLALTTIALGFADGPRVPVGRTRARVIADPRIAKPVLPPAQERAQNVQNPLPFEPTLSREFARADALRTYFEVVRRDRRSTVSLAVRVVDASGETRLSHDMIVGPGDPGMVDLRIPLETLPPGAYILRATGTDSRTTTSTATVFIVK